MLMIAGGWFLVPVPKDAVRKALKESFPNIVNLKGLNLLSLPAELNFPADMHPVIVSAGSNRHSSGWSPACHRVDDC
jgi:hypothetical protein